MTHIYVLSADRAGIKIGIHTGSQRKLESRYRTYLDKVVVHAFVETPHAKAIEGHLKNEFLDKRILHQYASKRSEWFDCELPVVLRRIDELNKQYSRRKLKMWVMIEKPKKTVQTSKPRARPTPTSKAKPKAVPKPKKPAPKTKLRKRAVECKEIAPLKRNPITTSTWSRFLNSIGLLSLQQWYAGKAGK